jgi:hypothetical protein
MISCSSHYQKRAYRKKNINSFNEKQAKTIIDKNAKNKDANQKHSRKEQEKLQDNLNDTNKPKPKKTRTKSSSFKFY